MEQKIVNGFLRDASEHNLPSYRALTNQKWLDPTSSSVTPEMIKYMMSLPGKSYGISFYMGLD